MIDTLNPQGGPRDHSKPMEKGSPEYEEYFGKATLKRGKKKQSPTNALTSAIQEYIQLIGGDAFRINTTGLYDEKLGMFRNSGSTLGVADLVGIYRGKFIAIEVKVGKDSLRPMQIKFQARVEKAGGVYFIAKDFDSTKKFIDSIV